MAFSRQTHTTPDLLYLAALSFFFLFYKLGSGSLASWDEAIYASVARRIVESGDWITLRFGDEVWLEKQPLAIWITALFYKLFGVHELSSRLFSALCGVGCVLVTYAFGRKLFDRWTGFLGALVLLSSSGFIHYTRVGMLEAPLTLFLMLALLFFWMGEHRNRYLIFSGITLGLAVMTKGFAAFLLFPVVWLYAVFSDKLSVLARSSYWIGVMLAVAVALPWHLAQLVMHRGSVGPDAFSWSFLALPFRALDAPGMQWYYYVRVLVDEYHPWVPVAVVSAPWMLFKAVKDRDPSIVLVTTWVFFLFTALSLFHVKRETYLFQVYPALSLSVGYALARVFRERSVNFVRAAFLVVLALHVPYSLIFDQHYSRNLKGIAPQVKEKVPAGQKVVLYDFPEGPALRFYAGRGSIQADTREELQEALKSGASYVLMRQADAEVPAASGVLSKNRLVKAAEYEGLKLYVRRN